MSHSMATLPATTVGEVRLTLRVPVGDGTDNILTEATE